MQHRHADAALDVHEFSVADVHRLIDAARRATALPEDGPQGWQNSPVDPCAVLAALFAACDTQPVGLERAARLRVPLPDVVRRIHPYPLRLWGGDTA